MPAFRNYETRDDETLRLLRNNEVLQRHLLVIPIEADDFNSWLSRRMNDELFGVIVDSSDDCIGFVQLSRMDQTSENVWLGIAIADSFRGSGHGTAVLTEIIKRSRASGVRKISLKVRHDNSVAISLYQRFGFEIKEVLYQNYFDGSTVHDVFSMQLDLLD
jgi:ribosomal protein S18 acetylase RimI-like enzyme